jgi:transcriptional regulator NrdR family protein
MQVIKRNGDVEEFSKEKFLNSLSKAGFTSEQIEEAYDQIEPELHKNISTDEIYEKALQDMTTC